MNKRERWDCWKNGGPCSVPSLAAAALACHVLCLHLHFTRSFSDYKSFGGCLSKSVFKSVSHNAIARQIGFWS